MARSCASFATFSYVIDQVLDSKSDPFEQLAEQETRFDKRRSKKMALLPLYYPSKPN